MSKVIHYSEHQDEFINTLNKKLIPSPETTEDITQETRDTIYKFFDDIKSIYDIIIIDESDGTSDYICIALVPIKTGYLITYWLYITKCDTLILRNTKCTFGEYFMTSALMVVSLNTISDKSTNKIFDCYCSERNKVSIPQLFDRMKKILLEFKYTCQK